MYINKRAVLMVLGIALIIAIAIISVNMRLSNNTSQEMIFEGYVPDDPDAEEIIGDAATPTGIALYDYEDVMPYFTVFSESMDFMDYIKNHIENSGNITKEWWVKNISFDSETNTLTFDILSDKSTDIFFVRKSNDDTYISRMYERVE